MKKYSFLIFLIIGIFIFHWVYKFFAGPDSINLILENRYKLLLLILAHIPTLYFDSLAWVVLMYSKKLSIISSFMITWIAQTSSKFLPTGNITGEFVRFFLAKKSGQKFSEASSTVLVDLFIATFSLLLIGLLAFILIINKKKELVFGSDLLYLILAMVLIFIGSLLFFMIIRNRLLSKFIKILPSINYFKANKIYAVFRLDISLYKLSFEKKRLFQAIVFRIIGWVAGAFEIYVFLWIIGVDANLLDVILIESVTAIIRSVAFFIPAGLGVQEFAFVMIGGFVGYSGVISFAIAIGRRLREIMVGIPAIIAFYLFYQKKI